MKRIGDLASGCVLGAAFIVFVAQALQNWSYLQDDVLIFFRYALQFHAGNGWVMNPGEPVNGCTSPLALWLITGLMSFLSVDWAIMALKAIGVACGVIVLLCTGWLTLLVMPGQRLLASVVVLLIATRFDFVLSMINGLETAPACAALMAALVALWKSEETQSIRMEITAAGLFVIAGLARPEMSVIYPLLCAVRYFVNRRFHWPVIMAYCVPFLGVLAFNHAYYGNVLPNTYFAKRATIAEGLAGGGQYLVSYLVPSVQPFGVLIVVACAAALWRQNRAAWLLVVAASVYALSIMRTHGDWMPDGRFAAPILPIITLSYCVALYTMARALRPAYQRTPVVLSCGLAIFFASSIWGSYRALTGSVNERILSGVRIMPPALPKGDLSVWTCGAAGGRRVIADWIKKNVEPGQLVMYSEMGLVPAMNPHVRFLDSYGLTDGTIAKFKTYKRSEWGVIVTGWRNPNTEMGRYVLERRPDWFIGADPVTNGKPAPFVSPEWRRVAAVNIYQEGLGMIPHSVYKRVQSIRRVQLP